MSDNIEYEAKILNVDEQVILSRLKELGASKIGIYNYARYVFNTIPESTGRWVRLRTDGESSTLAVKEISNDEITGTSEWEVGVSDFDTTLEILRKIGLMPKGYQENKRELFDLNGVEVSIDSWPKLSPYIEIEGKDEKAVESAAVALGYTKADLDSRNTKSLYRDLGIDLDTVKELRF